MSGLDLDLEPLDRNRRRQFEADQVGNRALCVNTSNCAGHSSTLYVRICQYDSAGYAEPLKQQEKMRTLVLFGKRSLFPQTWTERLMISRKALSVCEEGRHRSSCRGNGVNIPSTTKIGSLNSCFPLLQVDHRRYWIHLGLGKIN